MLGLIVAGESTQGWGPTRSTEASTLSGRLRRRHGRRSDVHRYGFLSHGKDVQHGGGRKDGTARLSIVGSQAPFSSHQDTVGHRDSSPLDRYSNTRQVVMRAAEPPLSPSVWYYCNNPEGYYPDVQQCPGGWRTVPASPQ